jgi:hypothetical protein
MKLEFVVDCHFLQYCGLVRRIMWPSVPGYFMAALENPHWIHDDHESFLWVVGGIMVASTKVAPTQQLLTKAGNRQKQTTTIAGKSK